MVTFTISWKGIGWYDLLYFNWSISMIYNIWFQYMMSTWVVLSHAKRFSQMIQHDDLTHVHKSITSKTILKHNYNNTHIIYFMLCLWNGRNEQKYFELEKACFSFVVDTMNSQNHILGRLNSTYETVDENLDSGI